MVRTTLSSERRGGASGEDWLFLRRPAHRLAGPRALIRQVDTFVSVTFHPAVQHWFRSSFAEPTPAQRLSWPIVAEAKNVLLVAPTGSGKTLAAFLALIDRLIRDPHDAAGVRVLYVSPLKALNNDIYRNLEMPLAGIARAAAELGTPVPELRTAVRTGDTRMDERQRMARR